MGGIIWLASYPKSGNTWTRTFIHNLLLNPKEPTDINSMHHFTLGDGGKKFYEQASGKPFEELTRREIAALIPKVHEIFTKSHPDSVFVKTHSALANFLGVPLITMEHTAGAIYIIRNPLDVVISLASHYNLSLDQAIHMLNNPKAKSAEIESNIEQFYGSWSNHVNSWMPFNPQYKHVMRYEDMLDKPLEVFGGLANFLGLRPPKERLLRAIEFSSFDAVRKQEDMKGFTENPDTNENFFRVGKSGQWKSILSRKQVNKVVKCHHQTMNQFGYLPD
ncbi:sulfotransferase domain-containing protein [Sneathiella sp. HT1-7]|uniref:sulfotransferase domain-containing protein n=1 Tax=Sneathiella sp. HT1-7 TaxID=2887192 RepID=UPI001D14976D|nr:sulfotransferase domain-containing protein [Sneathiella sp. HT1-7]MCC3303989.1 sulfotransferase domain-containing protein [Sneathiella sp. HT1-7]